MKKKGFISTSLIYSFFLVFLAITAALLNNYVANKTILLRYNEDALKELNTKKYSVTFLIYGAEANTETQKSQAFTNLVQNGNFVDTTWWQQSGTGNFSATSFSKNTALLNNFASGSYIYQNVHLVKNQQYYFSIDYAQTQPNPIQTYVEPLTSLVSQNTDGVWKRAGSVFYAEETTDAKPFVIGYSAVSYSNAYFTNAMLINLTEHFGSGNEPTANWMTENIDFFNGTINYLKEENLSGESELELTMVSQTGYDKVQPICTSDDESWIQTNDNVISSTYDYSDERMAAKMTVKDITSDLVCTVRWTE